MRSVEVCDKEWDTAARVRDRALTEARERVILLMKELALDPRYFALAMPVSPTSRIRSRSLSVN